MEQAGKVGMGGEVPRARRRVSRTAVLMAAAVVVLSVCCLTLSDLEAAPVEAVSVARNDVVGALNDDTERIIKSAVQKAVSSAEAEVQQDVKNEVKSAVKEAIEEAVSSEQVLTGTKGGRKLVHTLVKDAGKEATRAEKQEVKEYSDEMSHITNELDSQLGGLVSLHPRKAERETARISTSSKSRSSKLAAGKGHKDWVSLATKLLKARQSGSGWAKSHANSELQIARVVKEKEEFAKEEKTIKMEAAYQEGKVKKDVPFGSRKNPVYVRAEQKRDAQADADFKKLEVIRQAKELQRKHAREEKLRQDAGEKRSEEAEKYLKVMEKPVVPKASEKRVDRNELAAKYLDQLIQAKKTEEPLIQKKKMQKLSRARVRAEYEEKETLKAERDMKLLKKGVAIVKQGNTIEKVKLSPVIVKGVNVIEQEKKALSRSKVARTDRDALAQKYLKQLKPHVVSVGTPFHALPAPRKILKAKRDHLESKAQRYLKQLDAKQHRMVRTHHADRNALAAKYLHSLKAKKVAS